MSIESSESYESTEAKPPESPLSVEGTPASEIIDLEKGQCQIAAVKEQLTRVVELTFERPTVETVGNCY